VARHTSADKEKRGSFRFRFDQDVSLEDSNLLTGFGLVFRG
jgi:hypothetical protein